MNGQPLPLLDELKPWMRASFARSSGPGGQNVNKVASRAIVRLDFEACPLLREDQKKRIRQMLAKRLTHDGQLQVSVQQDRSQAANRRQAELQLVTLLQRALKRPKPRRPTSPTAGSRTRRLTDKRQRGQLKQARRGRERGDEN